MEGVPEVFQNLIVKGDRICGMPAPGASLGDTGPFLGIAKPATGQDSFSGSSQDHGSPAHVVDELLYLSCEVGMSCQLSKEEMLDYYIQTLILLTDIAMSQDVLPPRGRQRNHDCDHDYG